jgi:protein-L-isoaspartate(D-aspartate) O-methyltransferase
MKEPLAAIRRRFADQIGAAASLPAPLVDAFAAVPRERFLDAGPWLIWNEGQYAPALSPDADPARVYVNASIAIDPARHLFNGLPSFLGMSIAALELKPGHRVLHVGPGLGYYTAVMGELVRPVAAGLETGPSKGGSVLAIEVDGGLAARAQSLVLPGSPVEVRHGNGAGPFAHGGFDAILVNAGVTHPQTAWLDALAPGGRMVLPLTGTMPMPMKAANIGKGMHVLLTRGDDGDYAARTLSVVAIYSALELRDDALDAQLTASMLRGRPFTHLTRAPHARNDECFLHADAWCLRRG